MVLFAWQAFFGGSNMASAGISTLQNNYVAGAGVCEGCKNVGRRGGFEEGLTWCLSRGRRRDFVLCDVDV